VMFMCEHHNYFIKSFYQRIMGFLKMENLS